MFSRALQSVEKFTLPLIMSRRLLNGKVQSGCATFIVVNQDGWVLTAAHIIQDLLKYNEHCAQKQAYDEACASIDRDPVLLPKQKRKQKERIPQNYEWITSQAVLWGRLGSPCLKNVTLDPLADLAVLRLDPFDPSSIKGYPCFKDPTIKLLPGASLCRLGYPFHEIKAIFVEATNSFELAPGALPVPRFPNDGILTRFVNVVDGSAPQQPNPRVATFLETSTPGLRGQSGGPVFDVNGHICGVQSRTNHIPLGFAPTIKHGNREVTEHQFMHVGHVAHVKEAIRLFDLVGVSHAVSPGA